MDGFLSAAHNGKTAHTFQDEGTTELVANRAGRVGLADLTLATDILAKKERVPCQEQKCGRAGMHSDLWTWLSAIQCRLPCKVCDADAGRQCCRPAAIRIHSEPG